MLSDTFTVGSPWEPGQPQAELVTPAPGAIYQVGPVRAAGSGTRVPPLHLPFPQQGMCLGWRGALSARLSSGLERALLHLFGYVPIEWLRK